MSPSGNKRRLILTEFNSMPLKQMLFNFHSIMWIKNRNISEQNFFYWLIIVMNTSNNVKFRMQNWRWMKFFSLLLVGRMHLCPSQFIQIKSPTIINFSYIWLASMNNKIVGIKLACVVWSAPWCFSTLWV